MVRASNITFIVFIIVDASLGILGKPPEQYGHSFFKASPLKADDMIQLIYITCHHRERNFTSACHIMLKTERKAMAIKLQCSTARYWKQREYNSLFRPRTHYYIFAAALQLPRASLTGICYFHCRKFNQNYHTSSHHRHWGKKRRKKKPK